MEETEGKDDGDDRLSRICVQEELPLDHCTEDPTWEEMRLQEINSTLDCLDTSRVEAIYNEDLDEFAGPIGPVRSWIIDEHGMIHGVQYPESTEGSDVKLIYDLWYEMRFPFLEQMTTPSDCSSIASVEHPPYDDEDIWSPISSPLSNSSLGTRLKEFICVAPIHSPLSSPLRMDVWDKVFMTLNPKPDKLLTGSDDEEDKEDMKDYGKGGYHPVRIGDLFFNRYLVFRKLGWGQFSTVWLCKDLTTDSFVALKITKSADVYKETAMDEIKILKRVLDTDPSDPNSNKIIRLLHSFQFNGVNGTHVCLVFEVLGKNLLQLIVRSDYEGISMPTVKKVVKQLLQALDYLHSKCEIIHTDIKPENILVCISEAKIRTLAKEAARKFLNENAPVINRASCSATTGTTGTGEPPVKRIKNAEDGESTPMRASSGRTHLISDVASGDDLIENEGKVFLREDGACSSKSLAYQRTSPQPSRASANEDVIKKFRAFLAECDAADGITPGASGAVSKQDGVEEDSFASETKSNPEEEFIDFDVKLGDLGNACYIDKHFSEHVQTRQYRAVEAIVECGYGPPIDIWSAACVAFELATGDYLFEPKSNKKLNYHKKDDHLGQIIDLLGPIPSELFSAGKRFHEFFHADGNLIRIGDDKLRPWPMEKVLTGKYEWSVERANDFASFLKPMLEYDARKRPTAAECLQHPWLEI